ncbi:DNA adenine methylase [Pseudonocardia zijingensis]|uniref:DNA adenine methylase n=1 Tax=Pseudonocardia zijingensis TaxID=153376 RepID=A0ABN1N8W1_9PSEU
MTAPPFPYFGGKQLLASRIAAVFPPHRHYVEPFAGSLAVLLAKAPSPFETVNDLDSDLMTFWQVLRDQPDELARVCALTPHSRAEFEAARTRPDTLTDLERARRVWVYLTQGRGGVLRNTGWRHYKKPSGGTSVTDYLRGYVARIHPALERLQHVSLECRPALDVIADYGCHPDVLLYVDPPYLGSTRGWGANYRLEMRGVDEHAELVDALAGCRASVVLSGYPSQLYDDALAGWHRLEIPTHTGQSARGAWSARTEVLWMNRPIADQRGLFELGGTA